MIGNKLEPFKFWCQKVLPNVYDDSLSYYEYLCKLNEYLNEVIGQINTLTDNMEDYEADLTATWLETKSYIDNYFNNLDVQQEINNKLDAMAESGALSTLLAPIVGTQIGGVVAGQIGATVASQIGATVASQIDASVAGQISQPTATATTAWLAAHVDPVGSAVVVDNSLTIGGAAADANATGEEINSIVSDLSNSLNGSGEFTGFKSGYRMSTNVGNIIESSLRCTTNLILVRKGCTVTVDNIDNTIKVVLVASNQYDSDWRFTKFSYTAPVDVFCAVNCSMLDGTQTIDPTTVDVTITVDYNDTHINQIYDNKNNIEQNKKEMYTIDNTSIDDVRILVPFYNGVIDGNGAYNNIYKFRIANKDKIKVDEDTIIFINKNFRCAIHYFYNDTHTEVGWTTGFYKLNKNYEYMLCIARTTEDVDEIADINEFARSVLFINNGASKRNLFGIIPIPINNIAQIGNGTVANGNYTNVIKFRVATFEPFKIGEDVEFNVEEGFRYSIHTLLNGAFVAETGWQTGKTIISGKYELMLTIARTTEDASEIADIFEFGSKLKVSKYIDINSKNVIIDNRVIVSNPSSESLTHASYMCSDYYDNYICYYGGETATTEFIEGQDINVRLTKQNRANPYQQSHMVVLDKGETVGAFQQSTYHSPYDPCICNIGDSTLRVFMTLHQNGASTYSIGYRDVNKSDFTKGDTITICNLIYTISGNTETVPMTLANLKTFADLWRESASGTHSLGLYPILNGIVNYDNALYTSISFISDTNDTSIAPIIIKSTDGGANWVVLTVLPSGFDNAEAWECGMDITNNVMYLAMRCLLIGYTPCYSYNLITGVLSAQYELNNGILDSSRIAVLCYGSNVFVGCNITPKLVTSDGTVQRSRVRVSKCTQAFEELDYRDLLSAYGCSYFSLVNQNGEVKLLFTEDYRKRIVYNKGDIAITDITREIIY